MQDRVTGKLEPIASDQLVESGENSGHAQSVGVVEGNADAEDGTSFSGSAAHGEAHNNSDSGNNGGIKKCPICKTTLFSDMDTCYGCMYRFGSNPELEKRVMQELDLQRGQSEQDGSYEQSDQYKQRGQCNPREQNKIILPVIESMADKGAVAIGIESKDCLFNKFLVQFHGFLGDFIADAQVNIN